MLRKLNSWAHFSGGIFLLGMFFLIWQINGYLTPFAEQHLLAERSTFFRVQNGQVLKSLALGFEHLWADVLWIKTLQYVGQNSRAQEWPDLANFLNAVTDLDPQFASAYLFGGLVLPFGGEYTAAEKLLLKGQEYLPENGQISYHLGFLYFYYRDDPEKAIEAYEHCLQQKDCLPAAGRMIATLKARQGKVESAFLHLLDELRGASPEEKVFLEKKTEEIGKLLLLQKIVAISPPAHELSELIGKKFPAGKDFQDLRTFLEELTGEILISEAGMIDGELLQSPFIHNPYFWDKKTQTVRPERW